MKYLGIDYGDSKVGLAVGDSETGLALPYKIIKNVGWDKLFADLADIIKAERIETVVIGWPTNVNSGATEQTEKVRKFLEEFKTRFSDLATETNDERFSSQEAQKLGTGSKDDDVASMLMLQNYLDLPR
jgi:putative holliday junction resolvase